MTGETPGDRRDRELDEALGTSVPTFGVLQERLHGAYSSAHWGLSYLLGIRDEEQRAVASELIVAAAEGVILNLRELALSAQDLRDLVGPNGRAMPAGPEATLSELIEHKRIHRAITDAARAVGSTVDCLAAVVIGVLGLPSSLHLASGAALFALPELPSAAPSGQAQARERVAETFKTHADGPPAGWLAWALEFRDAVVHRGHKTQTWLQHPRGMTRRFSIRSAEPLQRLVRFEPHLRQHPWHPDILSLSDQSQMLELWLPEPATLTIDEIKRRLVTLIGGLADALNDALAVDRAGWLLPQRQWTLERVISRPRTASAASFPGFDTEYQVPVADVMVVHPRSADRLALAERLRQRLADAGEN